VLQLLIIDRLEEVIKDNGWSNTYFCASMGKSRSWILDMKHGKGMPDDDGIREIARVSKTTFEYLTGKTDIKNKPTVKNGEPMSDEDVEILKLFRELSPDERARHIEALRIFARKDSSLKK
jgi:transcriptional regulator with XRE-family HTH domain